MKKLTMTLVMSAILGTLAGCGGGGSGSEGVDNSAMTLTVKPAGDVNMAVNSSMNLNMVSSVRRASNTDKSSITSMIWELTPMNGETIPPVLSNGNCTGSNTSNATSQCSTTLTVPQTVTTGKWNVTATAKASNGSQRSESFVLSVDNSKYNLSAGDAQNIKAESNGSFNAVLLKGALTGTNGGKIIESKWVQISGPSIIIANAESINASFIPNQLGEYRFRLTVVVDEITINAETTVQATPKD